MDYGVILDLETTGIDPQNDRIIEIALLEFGVEADKDPVISRSFSAVEDPGIPVSDEILKITGVTREILAGQKIDWDYVRAFLAKTSIVIAHNAEFDRAFLDKSGELKDLNLHWGCSRKHIDWKKHNFRTTALNYLAADHGFVNPFAHRALFDCATTFRIVSPYLPELIARSYEREFKIRAVYAPFESKDVLKQRGYYWNQDARVWERVVSESQLEGERCFLGAEVYKTTAGAKHQEEELRS